MIKFITQRDIDLRTLKPKRKNLSHLNLSIFDQAQIPQEGVTTFQAISNYKKYDQQSQQLTKRLIVLKQQQRKFESKTLLNNSKLDFYRSIRDQADLHRKRSEQHRIKIAQNIHNNRLIIQQQRQAQAQKLKQTKRQMYFQKWYNYIQKKQHSKNGMNQTRLNLDQQLQKKRNIISQIKNYEQNQKSKVSQYFQKKKSQVKLARLDQKSKINQMAQSKYDQLQALSHIQSILLSRQARSRMISQQSTNRLNSVLSPKSNPNYSRNGSNIGSNPYDIFVI